MQITAVKIYRFSIPMVPFVIATGVMDYAQNTYVEVFTDAGLKGVGECSAFPVIVGETQDTCFVLAKKFAELWVGKDPLNIEDRNAQLQAYIAGNYTIKSAFDMCLYDISAKAKGLPLYKFLGGTYFEPESDLTIGIDSIDNMRATAHDFVANRHVNIIKVKLGKNAEEDILRIQAIRQAVGNNTKIRVDANQGYTPADAVKLLQGIEKFDIEFCEQPMRTYDDDYLPELIQQTAIPVMADESVYTHRDAERLIRHKATDSINIKLAKSGGIAEALKIHEICKRNNIPNMLGGMLESRIALSANVHLALACDNIAYHDFDSCLLGHLADPVINGVTYKGMLLQTPDLPGIGAEADQSFLAQCEFVEYKL